MEVRGLRDSMASRAQLEHPTNGQFRASPNGFWNDNLGFQMEERGVELLKSVHLHEAAVGAGALVRGAGNEGFKATP